MSENKTFAWAKNFEFNFLYKILSISPTLYFPLGGERTNHFKMTRISFLLFPKDKISFKS